MSIDPQDIHKAIKRPYYLLPTMGDVTLKLVGNPFFSVMDTLSGYCAIKLTHK